MCSMTTARPAPDSAIPPLGNRRSRVVTLRWLREVPSDDARGLYAGPTVGAPHRVRRRHRFACRAPPGPVLALLTDRPLPAAHPALYWLYCCLRSGDQREATPSGRCLPTTPAAPAGAAHPSALADHTYDGSTLPPNTRTSSDTLNRPRFGGDYGLAEIADPSTPVQADSAVLAHRAYSPGSRVARTVATFMNMRRSPPPVATNPLRA